ncbi:uncharacterized protein LOC113324120 [Papaver somniferum]|uniref:uncharacterized protein LOC113324120 n=1 Tax=Papaver somniferum TaxID=3469 RepID=UPI000E6FC759|nr:uncharacterized protein LOC113324120 [Papaver somniferum]
METPRILEIADANNSLNSTIKFLDGKTGQVSNEEVKITSWSKIVEKKMVSNTTSSPAPQHTPEKFGIHAHVKKTQRGFLWSEMEIISDLKKPWIALGDFNVVISQDEKIGGKYPNRASMLDFSNCLDKCELIQAPKTGLQFSWSNCQQGRNKILCTLDREVFNQQWLDLHGDWGYKVGLRIVSDHAPLLGECSNIPKPTNCPRKFQKMWIYHPTFLSVVKECWTKTVFGDPAFIFMQKLKNLKKVLNDWNWSVFGNVQVKIKEAEEKVQAAMQVSDSNPHDEEAFTNLVEAQNEHANRKVQANTLLKQNSREKWVQEDAANINYFHTKMKLRQAKNLISELDDGNDNIISDQSKISKALVQHFQQKFAYQEVNIDENLLNVIHSTITDSDQEMLDVIPDPEEIKNIVFEMDPDSSPGLDSYSGIFYRTCWEIIHEDLIAAIQFCWRRRFIPEGLNSNFLVLLPKCQGAKKANQFRLIGLSNILFRIFTKIITTRMNTLMVKLISPQQAAYVKGRSIHENVLLASEMINETKKEKRGGNVALKLDISQAYDSVSWKFLFQVLQKYGFSTSWCDWLLTLFESAKMSVMINGGPSVFFSMGRGLKRGYPLSPILFVLMEDVLSRNISHLVSQGKILPMVNKNGIHPTHLFFADDVFIFCNGAKKSLDNLFSLLDKYQASSGVLLAPGRITSAMVWPVVELIQKKLATWKGKLLSFADRLVLITSVLSSVPLYNMAIYKWPASVIKICERLIRNILWSGNSESRKYKTLSWKKYALLTMREVLA